MGEVSYRTSFVLCSLPFVAVVNDALHVDPRFSRLGLVLAAVVWVILLERIGRGGTPAGASAREVAIMRPSANRLAGLLLADNASRILLALVFGIAAFPHEWAFLVALYVATRLVGFQSRTAIVVVAALALTGVPSAGTARLVSLIAAIVLMVVFAAVALRDRFSLRALASGSDGSDARYMVQIGDWHGLVTRLVSRQWLPVWLLWTALGVAAWVAARSLSLPPKLFIPIIAFAAAHVSCVTMYEALGQPDRRHLVTRAAGGATRILVLGIAASLPVAVVVAIAADRTGRGDYGLQLATAVVVVWCLVLAEAALGGLGIHRATSAFGAQSFGQAAFAVRSVAAVAGVAIGYLPAKVATPTVLAGAVVVSVVVLLAGVREVVRA